MPDYRVSAIDTDTNKSALIPLPTSSAPDWVDRMGYVVNSVDSIPDGLVANSPVSTMVGAVFLRGDTSRKAIIKQSAPTTIGAIFTTANARLTARSLANIPEIGYRRSVAAPNWMFYDGTDPGDAATAVPSGWYVVTFVSGTDLYIEPLAAQVSQIVPYTGTTPDIPANMAMPAFALNTATSRITHWWNPGNLTWSAVSGAQSDAAASANDYIHVHATADQTTGLTVGSPVLFSTPTVQSSAGCSFSAGVFTLPANKTFRLEAQITWGTGTEVIVRWRNITSNTLIGGSANAMVSGRGCVASAVISTTQATTVRLEIVYVDNFTGFYAGTGRGSWAYIEEITRTVLSAPTNTTLFTPRSITGTGITTFQGRDNTVTTLPVTGIVAGSEVTAVTATGGATVIIKNSGRSGTAYIDVIPNGADTDITVTQTVWRRTVSANGANVNGAASANLDATAGAVPVALTMPANNELTGVTATNATITGFSASGVVTLIPNNNGNIVITPTFTPVTKATAQHVANAGTALNCGSIRLRMNTAANRGLQIQSNTGANLTWRSMSNWEGGGSGMNTGTATASGWTNLCDFNFSAISQFQNSIIWDETNNRKYLVFYTVQASFNNSPMMITEL